MWPEEKNPTDSPVQVCRGRTETLLHGTDSKQSGLEKMSREHCIYLGTAALEKSLDRQGEGNLIGVCLTINFKH